MTTPHLVSSCAEMFTSHREEKSDDGEHGDSPLQPIYEEHVGQDFPTFPQLAHLIYRVLGDSPPKRREQCRGARRLQLQPHVTLPLLLLQRPHQRVCSLCQRTLYRVTLHPSIVSLADFASLWAGSTGSGKYSAPGKYFRYSMCQTQSHVSRSHCSVDIIHGIKRHCAW